MPPAAVYNDPCHGHFVHDQKKGACPIEITSANRVVSAGVRPATTGTYIPGDIGQAVGNRDLRFLNLVDHTNDGAFDMAGADPGGVSRILGRDHRRLARASVGERARGDPRRQCPPVLRAGGGE